jgi:hypothetical protein
MRSDGARSMIGAALEAFAARQVERVDRAALWWLGSRTTLPRELVMALLEWASQKIGAKVEVTDVGGV